MRGAVNMASDKMFEKDTKCSCAWCERIDAEERDRRQARPGDVRPRMCAGSQPRGSADADPRERLTQDHDPDAR